MSVIVERADKYRLCNSCNSNDGVVEITALMRVGKTRQGTQIALCESCAQRLRFALNNTKDMVNRMSDYIDKFDVTMIESKPDAYPEEWNADYERGFGDALTAVLKLPSAHPGINPQKLLKAIYKHPHLGEYEKAVMTGIVDKLQEGENE